MASWSGGNNVSSKAEMEEKEKEMASWSGGNNVSSKAEMQEKEKDKDNGGAITAAVAVAAVAGVAAVAAWGISKWFGSSESEGISKWFGSSEREGISNLFGSFEPEPEPESARKKGGWMKAPGRPGNYILREDFEGDPRDYFRVLRGKK